MTDLVQQAVRFGQALIDTQDLDPIYTILYHSPFTNLGRKRWLVAYWLFYDAGVCSALTDAREPGHYYGLMNIAVKSARRGMERRHFRGPKAMAAANYIAEHWPEPAEMVDWAGGGAQFKDEPVPFSAVRDRLLSVPMFGPWIAWKAADMMERCVGLPISFSGVGLDIYKDPRQGAALLLKGDWQAKVTDDDVATVACGLARLLSRNAPPDRARPCNVQEAETVLCKYKAHVKGHYELGKDTRDIRESLLAQPGSACARSLLMQLKRYCSYA